MKSTGMQYPSTSVSDLSNVEPQPQISYGDEFENAFTESLSQAPTAGTIENSIFVGAKTLTDPTLNEGAWQKSQYYRPGIRYDKIANGNGLVSHKTAQYATANYDAESKRQERLNNLQPGIIGKAVKLGGYIAGQALDPLNILLFGKGFSLAGKVAQKFALGGEGLAGAAQRAALGFGATAAANVPGATLDYSQSHLEGTPQSPLDALQGVLENASIGALVHGVFGTRTIVTPSAAMDAAQTAVKQTFNNKMPDVSIILQKGYNDAREIERENLERAKKFGQPKSNLPDYDPTLGKASDFAPVKENEKPISPVGENAIEKKTTISLINKVDPEKLAKIKEEMKSLGAPTIQAMKDENGKLIALEGSHRLTAAKELGLVPNIEEVMKDISPEDRVYAAKMYGSSKFRTDLKLKLNLLNKSFNDIINENAVEPITKQQVVSFSNEQTKVDHDFGYDNKAFEQFQKASDIPKIKPDLDENIEGKYNDVKNSQDLDEIERAHIDSIDQDEEKTKTFTTSLKDLWGCLTGGAE